MRITEIVNEKVVKPFASLTASERLLCVLVGLLGGCFPVPALTTIVTALLCRLLHLTAPQVAAAMVVNLLSTPLELFLIPFFARAAALLLRTDTSTFTAEFLTRTLTEGGVLQLLHVASSMILHAVASWALLTMLVVLFLFAKK